MIVAISIRAAVVALHEGNVLTSTAACVAKTATTMARNKRPHRFMIPMTFNPGRLIVPRRLLGPRTKGLLLPVRLAIQDDMVVRIEGSFVCGDREVPVMA